jgi:hypothetical protein
MWCWSALPPAPEEHDLKVSFAEEWARLLKAMGQDEH